MENLARVVLALDEHDVAEEVMHFLDRSGARVVATATDERQLGEAVRQLEPDAVVASPSLLRRGASVNGSPVLALDTRESVGSLRAAIRAGARGFYLWPEERDELAAASRRLAATSRVSVSTGGRLIAVLGSRGGAGATFVATHLAAALARRGRDCVLVDLDAAFDDVGAVLSVPPDEPVPTLADLVALDEPGAASQLRPWTHPAGFRVIPGSPMLEGSSGAEVAAALGAVSRSSEVVIAHVPRVVSELTRAALAGADLVVVVLTLDVGSFRAAKRAIAAFGIEDGCRFVVNRAARAEVSPSDVERVFGRAPIGVIPVTSGVRAAQDRGRLLPPRGRAARALDRVAAALVEDA